MKKGFKIVLIVIACILVVGLVGGIIAIVSVGNVANNEEYKLGNDKIKSIKAIVEKRQVTAVSTETSNGITTKKVEYKSSTVQEDLQKYTQYLRNEGGFTLTKDMDLNIPSATVELGKESKDAGKLLVMTIDYNAFGYTIIIQKGEGTLVRY